MTLEHLLRDARYAVRTVSRARTFALVALVSLALGIGANTAIFSLVSSLLFSKPAMPNGRHLVEVHRLLPNGTFNAVSQLDLDDIREGAPAMVTGLSAYLPFTGQVGGTDGPGTVVLGELVNADYFSMLGLTMAAGRPFLPQEDRVPMASPVVVLGHRFWQNHMQADPRAVGSSLRLNGRSYTVVGVAPPGFSSHSGGIRVDVWAPFMMQQHLSPFEPEWDNLFALVRLSPGTTAAAFSQAMATIAARQDAARGRSDRRWRYSATPFDDIIFTPSFDGTIKAIAVLLLVVVGLVLVITCSNLAGFLLARATDRRKEMAIRMATGASRAAVVRQMVLEAMCLSLVGGALGLGVSYWLVRGLLATNPPLPIPLNLDVKLDGRVLVYTFAVSLAAGIFFGLMPALKATRMAIAPTLRGEGGGASSGGTSRIRNGLIAGQLALSLVLLVSAGMFIQNMRAALRVSPGFSTAPAGILTVDLRGSGYTPAQYSTAYRRLRDAVAGIPGVERVAAANRLPMTIGNSGVTLNVPGFDDGRGGNTFRVETAQVSAEYFGVLGIPLRSGEAFGEAAPGAGAPRVAILNRVAAEHLWPGVNAVGRSVEVGGIATTIVGVSETARDRGLTESPRPMVYLPMAPEYPSTLTLLARGRQPAARLADDMRRAAIQTDDQLFVVDARTLDQHLGVMYFLPRMAAWMLSGFAVLALALGCIGLFGAVSHAVARRSRELAIRLALGATSAQVVTLVVRSGMTVVLAGGVVGLALSWTVARLMARFLIGGGSVDPVVFGGVPLLLAGVALLASWLPARRAAKLNPMDAIRAE